MSGKVPINKARQSARLHAVQALYQMELAGQKSKMAVREFDEHWLAEMDVETGRTDRDFFELIVLGVVAEQAAIDAAIAGKLAKGWRLSRLDTVLRAILRCATFELMRLFEVPAIVVIDQYVGLTKEFYDDKQADFINAALDKLAREKRPGEFGIPAPL